MNRGRLIASICFIALGITLIWRQMYACGGDYDWRPYSFGDPHQPDHPATFRKGDLGVLSPGMNQSNLVIAWRSLKGLPVEAAKVPEPMHVISESGAETAKDEWLAQRQKWMVDSRLNQALGDPPPIEAMGEGKDFTSFFRILPAAFTTAASTFESRLKDHGSDRAAITEWLRGQDDVFGCTADHPRIPKPVITPLWLKADRDYQIACAHFYSENYREARTAFSAIAKDTKSLWQPWGAYLRARTCVRQFTRKGLEPLILNEAKKTLQSLLAQQNLDPKVRSAAQNYLDLVRNRLEPETLQNEILADLSKKNIREGLDVAVRHLVEVRRYSKENLPYPPRSLGLWLSAFEFNSETSLHEKLLETWKHHPDTPLLIAYLQKAPGNSEDLNTLWATADKLPRGSKAQPTLRWLKIQHSLSTAAPELVPGLIEVALAKEDLPIWAVNELRMKRRWRSKDTAEWLHWAPSKAEVSVVDPHTNAHSAITHAYLLNYHEAEFIGQLIPLDLLVSALKTQPLTGSLSDRLATEVWWRGVLLERWAEAQELLPQVDTEIRSAASLALNAPDPEERRFRLALLSLEFPGLRPRISIGLDRSRMATWMRLKTHSRNRYDNYWCSQDFQEHRVYYGTKGYAFLDSAAVTRAEAENKSLAAVPCAQIWFGEAVMAFAEAHPNDPRIPGALRDVVASTHLASCPEKGILSVSKRSFEFLHRHFPNSPESKATPYYYGDNH